MAASFPPEDSPIASIGHPPMRLFLIFHKNYQGKLHIYMLVSCCVLVRLVSSGVERKGWPLGSAGPGNSVDINIVIYIHYCSCYVYCYRYIMIIILLLFLLHYYHYCYDDIMSKQ